MAHGMDCREQQIFDSSQTLHPVSNTQFIVLLKQSFCLLKDGCEDSIVPLTNFGFIPVRVHPKYLFMKGLLARPRKTGHSPPRSLNASHVYSLWMVHGMGDDLCVSNLSLPPESAVDSWIPL